MYDVAVLGGGIAGKALFAALKQARHQIAIKGILIDHAPGDTMPASGYSNRVSSINNGHLAFLQSLGVDIGVRGSLLRAQPYRKMLLWYGDHHQSAVNIEQSEPLAWIVENGRLSSALDRCLQGDPLWEIVKDRADIICDYEEGKNAKLKIADREIDCHLLVGADGKSSGVARWAGIEHVKKDYNQHAIVATLKLNALECEAKAYQRFLPTGPMAWLPLDHEAGVYSMVWTLPTQIAKGLMQNGPDWTRLVEAAMRYQWADSAYWTMHQAGLRGKQNISPLPPADLQADLDLVKDQAWRQSRWSNEWWAWQHGLPRVREVSSVAAFPLQTQVASFLIRPGVALLGDAAHTVHPMAGQGLNLGLGDARVLSDELVKAWGRGQLAGELGILENYQRRRAAACLGVTGAIHGLHRLFHGDPHSTLRWDLLPRAMQLLDRLDPLKRLTNSLVNSL